MKVSLIVLRTTQPKTLAAFYHQLGMEFDYHRHGKGHWHYAAMVGKLVFEIYPLLKDQKIADSSLRLGFEVRNLDDLIEVLSTNQVEIVSRPIQSEYGYFAVIKDLDGRKIELKEESTEVLKFLREGYEVAAFEPDKPGGTTGAG